MGYTIAKFVNLLGVVFTRTYCMCEIRITKTGVGDTLYYTCILYTQCFTMLYTGFTNLKDYCAATFGSHHVLGESIVSQHLPSHSLCNHMC